MLIAQPDWIPIVPSFSHLTWCQRHPNRMKWLRHSGFGISLLVCMWCTFLWVCLLWSTWPTMTWRRSGLRWMSPRYPWSTCIDLNWWLCQTILCGWSMTTSECISEQSTSLRSASREEKSCGLFQTPGYVSVWPAALYAHQSVQHLVGDQDQGLWHSRGLWLSWLTSSGCASLAI